MELLDGSLVGIGGFCRALAFRHQREHSLFETVLRFTHGVHSCAQTHASLRNFVFEQLNLLSVRGEVCVHQLQQVVEFSVICAKLGLDFGQVQFLIERVE